MTLHGCVSRLLWLACSISVGASFAVVAQALDLEDCRILFGQTRQKELNATLASQRRKADAGDLAARKWLAGVANNRFACYLEELDEGAGWSVIEEPVEGAAGNSIAVQSTTVVDAATIKKNKAAHRALREAFVSAQAVADDDVAYRNMAARLVADYADALPDRYADAYRDAIGVRQVVCHNPEVLSASAAQPFCLSAKSASASLYPRLSSAERAAQEAAGLDWAARYLEAKRRGSK